MIINIPDLISSSPYLQVYNSGGNSGSASINMSREVQQSMVWTIISYEMRGVREMNPDVDFDKIQEMLRSTDGEMKQLGLTTLDKYTVQTIINDFFVKNSTNITAVAR